ncbi:hypothetical protein EUGRSUZ_D00507 [Eucalyptus grandis]|uniref:Uncharacterized protein n=2 Tax=Eucalyptus grandis TaxID=71139 RepID=A0ACC3L4Y4_EUCGR|nr:hypothetical protein EUGRSUZ_D00507 [Eucalyptus grandis]
MKNLEAMHGEIYLELVLRKRCVNVLNSRYNILLRYTNTRNTLTLTRAHIQHSYLITHGRQLSSVEHVHVLHTHGGRVLSTHSKWQGNLSIIVPLCRWRKSPHYS